MLTSKRRLLSMKQTEEYFLSHKGIVDFNKIQDMTNVTRRNFLGNIALDMREWNCDVAN